jgi:hypothetical protein
LPHFAATSTEKRSATSPCSSSRWSGCSHPEQKESRGNHPTAKKHKRIMYQSTLSQTSDSITQAGQGDDIWSPKTLSDAFSPQQQPYSNVSHLETVSYISCSTLCDMSRQLGGLSVSPRTLSYVVGPDSPPTSVRTTTWVSGGHYYYLSKAERCVCRQNVGTDAAYLLSTQKALGTYIGSYGLMCHASGATCHLSKEEETPPPKREPIPHIKKRCNASYCGVII